MQIVGDLIWRLGPQAVCDSYLMVFNEVEEGSAGNEHKGEVTRGIFSNGDIQT